jgi:hypothetical protein
MQWHCMEINKLMKLLVNDKELAKYLESLIDLKEKCSAIELTNTATEEAVKFIIEKRDHPKFVLEKFKAKFKEKLWRGISKDLEKWNREVTKTINTHKSKYFKHIHKRVDYFLNKLDEKKVIDNYIASDKQYFIKTVGLQIDSTAKMIRRKDFNTPQEDCLLRNTVGNENILIEKIDNNLPFWFIDSGYTNFIEPNKKWHRLVRNHLHFNNDFDAPTDRLTNFVKFPKPWNKEGKKILIVEPGPFAAGIFHVEAKSWGAKIAEELRQYTDRPIEIREKTNKKTRKSLYKQLLDGDYYCTISINSNSAVESVWAGIPAITLDKHISNPVTRQHLHQINNLYYGPLGNWLAWLSYSQFTYEELLDGTALKIIRKYHNV